MEQEVNGVRPLAYADCVCCDSFRLDLSAHAGRRGRRFFRLLDERPFVHPEF